MIDKELKDNSKNYSIDEFLLSLKYNAAISIIVFCAPLFGLFYSYYIRNEKVKLAISYTILSIISLILFFIFYFTFSNIK